MIPNTYQEIYDTHTCLNFSKMFQNVCLYQTYISKSRCNFITLLGKYVQQKKVGWEVIFSELGFAGSGARKPRQEFEDSTLEPFFHVFLRLIISRALIMQLNYHIKASVKLMTFVRENQIIPWQGVYVFYQHCFTKSQEHIYCCDET